MRRAVIILALTTAALAASTLWLLIERSRSRTFAEVVLPAEPRIVRAYTPGDPALDHHTNPPAASLPAPESAAKAAVAAQSSRPTISLLDRKYLQDVRNPERRHQLFEEARASARDSQGQLGELLGLDAVTYERLLDLQAEQELRAREAFLRCIDDPDCDLQAQRSDYDFDDPDIAALLGPDKRQRFENHQRSLPERDLVISLRGRLSDSNALSDANAERLITALAAERRRRDDGLIAASGSPSLFYNLLPVTYSSGDTRETLLAKTQEYYDTLHAHAARILTPAQLAIYDGIQKQRMGGAEFAIDSWLENKDHMP